MYIIMHLLVLINMCKSIHSERNEHMKAVVYANDTVLCWIM